MIFLSLLAGTLLLGSPMGGCPPIASSGDWIAAANTATVTATTRTITFTGCSTGVVKISTFGTINSETLTASNNGGAFGSSLTEGSTITIAATGNTLNFRGNSMTSGSYITANVVDNVTGGIIAVIDISRP